MGSQNKWIWPQSHGLPLPAWVTLSSSLLKLWNVLYDPIQKKSPTLGNRGHSYVHICGIHISTIRGPTFKQGAKQNFSKKRNIIDWKMHKWLESLTGVCYFYCCLSWCLPAQTENNDVTTNCLLENYHRLVMITDGNRTKNNQKKMEKQARGKKEWAGTAPRWSRVLSIRWGCRGPAAPPAWPCSWRPHTRSPDAPSSLWSESKQNIPDWHSTRILQNMFNQ